MDEVTTNTMHVNGITMTAEIISRGPWSRTRAVATIPILDSNDDPVEGATVDIEWSGLVSGTESGETGEDGDVTFES